MCAPSVPGQSSSSAYWYTGAPGMTEAEISKLPTLGDPVTWTETKKEWKMGENGRAVQVDKEVEYSTDSAPAILSGFAAIGAQKRARDAAIQAWIDANPDRYNAAIAPAPSTPNTPAPAPTPAPPPEPRRQSAQAPGGSASPNSGTGGGGTGGGRGTLLGGTGGIDPSALLLQRNTLLGM